MNVPMPGSLPPGMHGMLPRSRFWTAALWGAFLMAVGWILLPGMFVVLPADTSDLPLPRSALLSLVYPFRRDWVYLFDFAFTTGPLLLVLLAQLHWRRKIALVRTASVFLALIYSAMFAFHPARRMMDLMLMGVVGVWAIILLVAFRSKASPGSALIALLAIQLAMLDAYVGLGSYRGLPFVFLMGSLSTVFLYGLLNYTRKLRHRILGRFTVVMRPKPAQLEQQRRSLMGDQWKLS